MLREGLGEEKRKEYDALAEKFQSVFAGDKYVVKELLGNNDGLWGTNTVFGSWLIGNILSLNKK